MKKKLVLSLGSNLGNRYAYLLRAIQKIEKYFNSKPVIAHFYETPPWGNENQSRFINTAIYLHTDIPLDQCLKKVQAIEKEMGRLKTEKWGPRMIDIDILFYEDDVVEIDELVVPHQYLHQRAFVLKPLQDILPNFIHPLKNKTIIQLIEDIDDNTLIFSKTIGNE
ncbi:MAG: 2-amino-4-hydroxy-6-hydroxymethyldihydropteridine diphosphokinase [Bacteroidetes bacterium]|nr:2-amino-4-hydroxy-6-hydroxymethyldihydropteridine diphosphokinase [Bacteroidota bacterium]